MRYAELCNINAYPVLNFAALRRMTQKHTLTMNNKYTGICLIALLQIVVCVGCVSHAEGDSHEEEHEHEHSHNIGEIVLEPEQAELLGVAVDTIHAMPFSESLRVSAEIMTSNDSRAVISAPTSGVITLVGGISVGAHISVGQVMAHVSARNVSGGDPDRAARVALENAQREVDRLTPLLAEGLVTTREYNEAKANLESARAAYSPSAASGTAVSPKTGIVTEIYITDGEYVTAGQPLAAVSGSTDLILRALVPANKASMLANIRNAVIAGHDGTTIDISDYDAKLLSSSSATASQVPGYIQVYFSFDGSAPIVAGAATEAYLIGKERQSVISVPKEALVEQMGETFVYVRRSDHTYLKRPVETGSSDGTRIEITNGLNEGGIVVVAGSTFVRLAEQSTVAPEGHSHNH